MKTDGLGLSSLLFHPGRPRTYRTSPKPKPTSDSSSLPDKVSVSSQAELDEVLKDDRVSSGEIPILLPEIGSFEITSGTPRLHVAAGDPWIRVSKDSAPTIIAFGSSKPFMKTHDSSKPILIAQDTSAPLMLANNKSAPLMGAYGTSEPAMRSFDRSKPYMDAYDSSKPVMSAWDSSKPIMNAYHASKPAMRAYGSSSPTVNWKSTAPNPGLADRR